MDQVNCLTMARAVQATQESIILEMQDEDESMTMSSETWQVDTIWGIKCHRG